MTTSAPARPVDRRREAPQTGVDGLRGVHRGIEIAGMADHVAVGVVDNHQVEAALVDGRDQPVGDLERRHLGLEVIGRDPGRRHQDTLLAGERPLFAAVEEECDMGVFLGLGDAKLRHAGLRHHLAKNARKRRTREQDGEEFVEAGRIRDHAAGRRETHSGAPREAVEIRIEQRAEQLAHPVGAEVAGQQPVAAAHAGVAADHRRQHELVGFAARVGGGDRPVGVGGPFPRAP